MRIDRRIGDDPAELAVVADAVVRGERIVNAEIKYLRKLIEAVQAHPRARLALPRDLRPPDWAPPPREDDANPFTNLTIEKGVILDGDCEALDVRVTLICSARFAGQALFRRASFAGQAWFRDASFAGLASFRGASFAGRASFVRASFAGAASFGRASFVGAAAFGRASFVGRAWFDGASFAGQAWFDRASFAGDASFDRASFVGQASFDGASFATPAWFGEARFAGAVSGDFRRCNLRTACFAEAAAQSPTHSTRRSIAARAWRRWSQRHFGWNTVRGLGQLNILSRVSLFALIFVPVIVAFWPAVRAAAGAYHRYTVESHDELPHIGATLALTFLAAVAVTLGLLAYQVFAPEEVRKHDLDAFIDRAHQRYPENAPDRDDGLRRAIEHLEQIAYRRPDRHNTFVTHHGDTIWVPPRDKIEWFNDPDDEVTTARQALSDQAEGPAPDPTPAASPAPQPAVGLRGAERRRIVIEEGARAEYGLKSRQGLAAAWLSFALYMIGIAFLLSILTIQIHRVLDAAGWV